MITPKPRMLDAFCGGGGCTKGYQRAGFHVTGVDTTPQPRYCGDAFIQADALEVLADREFLAGFQAVAASPTCQTFAAVTDWRGSRDDHPDLLTPTLQLLEGIGLPWVVENVPEAAERGPLRADYLLCGTQFGLRVRRHRAFQVGNWAPPFELMPPHNCHRNPDVLAFDHAGEAAYRDALGVPWMSVREARQAIPPAYTEHIGAALLAHLLERAA